MICVLDVIQGPARGKRIWLKENQCIEIGRISTADFSIPADTHLSRRHLLLDSTKNGFRIRDVGSANGTFLNDVRILVQELKSGDTVRAGLSAFSVTLCQDGENPHAKDGVTFSRSLQMSNQTESTIIDSDLEREPGNNLQESVEVAEESVEVAAEKVGSYRTLGVSDRVDLESTVRMKLDEASDEIDAAVPWAKHENPKPNSTEKSWWKSFFTQTEDESIYQQASPFSSPLGNFLGIMHEFESEFQIAIIVNESQLPELGRELLAKLRQSGSVTQLSRSLCYLMYERTKDFQKLVNVSEGEDALICIGTQRALPLQSWEKHANSLSYPSMFISHLKNSESRLKESFLRTGSFSLFEMNREGNLVLMICERPPLDSNTK